MLATLNWSAGEVARPLCWRHVQETQRLPVRDFCCLEHGSDRDHVRPRPTKTDRPVLANRAVAQPAARVWGVGETRAASHQGLLHGHAATFSLGNRRTSGEASTPVTPSPFALRLLPPGGKSTPPKAGRLVFHDPPVNGKFLGPSRCPASFPLTERRRMPAAAWRALPAFRAPVTRAASKGLGPYQASGVKGAWPIPASTASTGGGGSERKLEPARRAAACPDRSTAAAR